MSRGSSSLQPRSLQNLRAYQLAKKLGHLVYDVTIDFPRNEFRLIGQMRGAAISVFGNIAEGYGRNMLGDYIRFCEIARGSLFELGSYIEFCQERKMFKAKDEQQLTDVYHHTRNTLGALLRSLRERKTDGSWDHTYKSIKEETALYDLTPEDHSPNLPTSQPPNSTQDNHDV